MLGAYCLFLLWVQIPRVGLTGWESLASAVIYLLPVGVVVSAVSFFRAPPWEEHVVFPGCVVMGLIFIISSGGLIFTFGTSCQRESPSLLPVGPGYSWAYSLRMKESSSLVVSAGCWSWGYGSFLQEDQVQGWPCEPFPKTLTSASLQGINTPVGIHWIGFWLSADRPVRKWLDA